MEDSRFAHFGKDPRFRPVPRQQRKVRVDDRFKSMFHDSRFKLKYSVDKRGRPVNFSSAEQLEKFYDLGSESDEDDNVDDGEEEGEKEEVVKETQPKKTKKVQRVAPASPKTKSVRTTAGTFTVTPLDDGGRHSEAADDLEASDSEVADDVKTKLRDLSVDYARGEGWLFSESSSDDDSPDEGCESDESDLIHDWGELDKDAETTDTATRRLAVCNMDWDRIRAVDLMVVLHSFAPQGGVVEKVTIYPSEYGLERMKEEETSGPKELVQSCQPSTTATDGDDDDAAEYHAERLRQYQLNRLKYYYAVVDCDSAATAERIYEECDGQEFESSAARLDLRYIGDELEFDASAARDVCDAVPDASRYEPRLFLTSALQQAQPQLTWDETDPARKAALQKLFGKTAKAHDVDEVRNYVAMSSSSDDDDDVDAKADQDDASSALTTLKPTQPRENTSEPSAGADRGQSRIAKYRNLLAELAAQEEAQKTQRRQPEMEMEISWGVGLQDKAEKLVRQKLDDRADKTVWEQRLAERRLKRKALKQQKKQEKQGEEGEDDDSPDDEEEEDIPSDVDMNDPYFREEFETDEFRRPEAKAKTKTKTKTKTKNQDEARDETRDAGQLELLLMDEQEDKRHFSLKSLTAVDKKKSKKRARDAEETSSDTKSSKTDNFELRVGDARFAALYTSHHFNVDPSDPNFKKTPGMDAILNEKLRRRQAQSADATQAMEQKTTPPTTTTTTTTNGVDSELSRLVRSVKAKTAKQRPHRK